jgi:hypothetical protein
VKTVFFWAMTTCRLVGTGPKQAPEKHDTFFKAEVGALKMGTTFLRNVGISANLHGVTMQKNIVISLTSVLILSFHLRIIKANC